MNDLLKKWQAPKPTAALDRRVWSSFRQIKNRRRIWITCAIAAPLIIAIARWPRTSPKGIEMDSQIISTPSGVTVETHLDAAGFQPLRDAKLVVVKESK